MNGADCGKCGYVQCRCDSIKTQREYDCAIDAIEDAIENRRLLKQPCDKGLEGALRLLRKDKPT